MPKSSCLSVMAGFHPDVSRERQTYPEGKMLGWGIGGVNWPAR